VASSIGRATTSPRTRRLDVLLSDSFRPRRTLCSAGVIVAHTRRQMQSGVRSADDLATLPDCFDQIATSSHLVCASDTVTLPPSSRGWACEPSTSGLDVFCAHIADRPCHCQIRRCESHVLSCSQHGNLRVLTTQSYIDGAQRLGGSSLIRI